MNAAFQTVINKYPGLASNLSSAQSATALTPAELEKMVPSLKEIAQATEALAHEDDPMPTRFNRWLDSKWYGAYPKAIVQLGATVRTGIDIVAGIRWVIGLFRGTV